MHSLVKRKIAKSIFVTMLQSDYELTEYGEAVCQKHKDSVREQIRLEKWRRRALKESTTQEIQETPEH